MNRSLPRLARVLVLGVALSAVACGSDGGGITGGGGGTGPTGANFNKEPINFVRGYFVSFFNVFTGRSQADDVMKLFEESCRNKVAAADVAKGLEKERERDAYPKLKGANIEDIDFQGKAKVAKTNDGATVTIPTARDSRVKVNGKWQNAFEYFKSVGFITDDDDDETSEEELILRNGRYYWEDCSDLEDIAASGKRANATPTPARSTPTPQRGTPTVTSRTPAPGATVARTPTPSGTAPRGTSTPPTIGR